MELICVGAGRHAGLRTVGQGRAGAKPPDGFFSGFFYVFNLSAPKFVAQAMYCMRSRGTVREK
jgi:hypothetical protein